ncbi:MAG: aminotransferase class III-fold pyridoxal phosphate-dependent enzyme [Candidatus Acidiferrales bacterium]
MSSTVQSAPRLSQDEAVRIAAELYGLAVTAAPLPSERDQNCHLRDSRGQQFVLKVANSQESLEFLEMQNSMMRFLSEARVDLDFPRIIASKSGVEIPVFDSADGRPHYARLLTWIEGVCLAAVRPHSRKLLRSLGRALAQMDAALTGFEHPAAHRHFYWDIRRASDARKYLPLLPDSRRSLVEHFLGEWDAIDWSRLRTSIIQNDANDYNVLVDEPGSSNERSDTRVVAILDYGDVVHTATICELAVALAYAMLDKSDPIDTAAQVVAAYHEVYPLTEDEVDSLFALVTARLCCSVCYAAHQAREIPGNDYLMISNAPVWALLEKLSGVPPEWPCKVFRFACGMPLSKEVFTRARPTRERLLDARRKFVGPSLSVSYKSPLHIVCGSRQYLYDADGRRYLDCVNNVAHVGHSHPRVVRAAAEQMELLNTNTRYLNELMVEYAERLTATFPEPLRVVYLVCSGSEANELALRLARAHTGREEVIVEDAAYHGNTTALIGISPYKFDGPGGRGPAPHVHKVPMPDVYRGAYRDSDAGSHYARHVADAARSSRGLAAFFCESAISCGGQIILPQGYLRDAYAVVREAGGVCVADEVQTGFGRAGEHFWMFESQGVAPDIVTLGKPIGNGHPLGAVVTTPEIAKSFANGMEYFNTFGGNPVSCAVGLAVLEVIRDEELQENARDVGQYFMERLRYLGDKHPLIGDVRGLGLFIGVELVRDRQTLEPADSEASAIIEQMKARGVLMSTDGPFHNVLKIKPPIVFSKVDTDLVVSELDAVLTAGFVQAPE